MREFKFRAWNKSRKKIVTWDEILSDDMRDRSPIQMFLWKHLEWMQYTGLKVQGKEIYEGDILGIDFGVTGVVKYDEGGTAFYIDVIEYKDTFNVEDGEAVIGNIYENPELLGKQ